ncbi:MAG: DNA-binding protein WhiA [Clostridia bacterium]|nr:DNA-binding protein WhiA [Clostridia bacterium]
MSFSKETKNELCSSPAARSVYRHSLVYGMVLFSKIFSQSVLSFTTECKSAAMLYSEQISALTMTIVDMSVKLTHRGGENRIYNLSVPDSGDCAKIYDFFGHVPSAPSLRINRSNIDDDECLAYFLRGAFIVCGNVTDPEKDYHLEFVVPHMNLANDLSRIISEIEVIKADPKVVKRKGSYIVYIKGSDCIADMLAYIGAPMASLEVVQQQIYRSLRNRVNRQINSETANSNKTAAAAARQLQAIEIIQKERGLSYLSDDLRALAQLRIDNPEYNLRELGAALDPPISRSGVNHRLMRIMEIAKELSE